MSSRTGWLTGSPPPALLHQPLLSAHAGFAGGPLGPRSPSAHSCLGHRGVGPTNGRNDELAEVRTSSQGMTSVDVDDLTGDPARLLADEEAREMGDVFGFADVTERRVLDVARVDLRVARDAFHQLR